MKCGVSYTWTSYTDKVWTELCDLPVGHPGEHFAHDLGYTCDCGEYIFHWQVADGSGHEQSRDHIVGLMRRLDDRGWETVMDTVEHGFGWAESESMATGDEEWVGLVVKELIEAWRVSSGVPV